MDGRPIHLPQLSEPLLQHIAQLAGPSARPCLRATCRALRSPLAPTRMQLLLGPNPSDNWSDDDDAMERHAELVQHFQQDWSLSESLAARWQHVTTGQVVIGGYADNRPMRIKKHSTTRAVQQLYQASDTLAQWGHLEEVQAPFSRALVTTLVSDFPQLRALELSDSSYKCADLAGSEWDPNCLQDFYRREVWLSLRLLKACPSLRQLRVQMLLTEEVDGEGWRVFSQLTQLQTLELSGWVTGSDEGHAVFSCLGALTQLTRLVLSNSYVQGDPVTLGPFPYLQHLAMDITIWSGTDEGKLVSLVGCPQLTYLCVGTSERCFGLSAGEPLQQLQVLDLEGQCWDDGEMACALASCPRLRALRARSFVHPPALPDGAFQHLQQLQVQWLGLPDPPMPASPAGTLAAVGQLARLLPGLTSLCVGQGVYEDTPVPHSPGFLRGHTALRHLGLPGLHCLQHEGADERHCLLDAADLAALPGLTSLAVDFSQESYTAGGVCPPALLCAILQPAAWQHMRQVTVRGMQAHAQLEQVVMLLRVAPALRALRLDVCGAAQLMDSVPQLCSMHALRTITLSDNGRGTLLAAGCIISVLPDAPRQPFLQCFLCAFGRSRHQSLACVHLELQPLTEADVEEPQQPHDPECGTQRAAMLRRIRGHVEAVAHLLPEGQRLPFAVHIEEVEAAPAWPE